MPFESQWYIDDRVLYICQWGVLTLEEAVSTDREIARATDAANLPEGQHLHGVVDSRLVTGQKMTPKALQNAFAMLPKPTEGWVVTVPGNSMHAFMTQFMAQSQGMLQREFENPEKALEFIIQVDRTLINLPVNKIDIYDARA